MSEHWPVVDLRLRTRRLELRPPDDEELAALADLLHSAAAGPRPAFTSRGNAPS